MKADGHTSKHTDTLITILHNPTGDDVTTISVQSELQKPS